MFINLYQINSELDNGRLMFRNLKTILTANGNQIPAHLYECVFSGYMTACCGMGCGSECNAGWSCDNIEETCKKAFPDYDFYRAFTSGMIIRKWARTKNVIIHNPDEVMKRLVAEGYEEVICQPTHIINGLEYDKMMNMLLAYKDQIPTIKVGTPLLTEEEDYKEACEIVMQELEKPLAKDEAFVFMGHGTEHFANSAYSQFENMLRDLGHESTYVGTVEGFPGLDYVIRRLKIRDIKKVYVMPLMIVAGDHARNDLAGAEADSWDSILKADGFETEVIMKGLGEIDAIAEMFVKHLKKAESL